ncbi:CFI-box-CTERM domain-containing protein [Ascidiimonas sp. W6]|uniref:CFI-box-CTERM domain-containing protein n=1 Tax=Ascidiimonas meishanensis TaxID=3128903 RepID=UPI0030EB9F61
MKDPVRKNPISQAPSNTVSAPLKAALDTKKQGFPDGRPEAILQGKFQQMANTSAQVHQLGSIQAMANSYLDQNMFQQSEIVQRQVILQDGSDSLAFEKAFGIFMNALKSQGGEIGNYLRFVNDKKNHHNLIFRTIPAKPKTSKDKGDLHGVTNVVFSGTSEDILKHMFDENIDPDTRIEEIMGRIDPVEVMKGVDILIEIVVSPEMTEPIFLETLNHEFTVHAIKWHQFIQTTFAKDKSGAMAALQRRIGTMRNDHDEFGSDQNQLYKNVRKTILEAIKEEREPELDVFGLPETQADELMRISRDAIHSHRPRAMVQREMDDLFQRVSDLDNIRQPLIFKKKKTPPPKKNRCCYITTACVEARGLPDDCEELTLLRDFRDTYLMQKPNGEQLIKIYYKHSPYIVHCIRQREDEEEILNGLYKIIKYCAEAIKRGDFELAYQIYCEMVLKLKELFIPELECEIPAI